MIGAATFCLRVNWRGKLLLGELWIASLCGRLGLQRAAVAIGERVMSTVERRDDWFDVLPRKAKP
jgi:hypothetical protein